MANPSAAAMFATTVEDMQGSPLGRFLTPAAGHRRRPGAPIFGDSGRVGRRATDYAVSGIRAGGETFPLEGSVSTVHGGRHADPHHHPARRHGAPPGAGKADAARMRSCASCRPRCKPSAKRNAPTSRANCTTTSASCWPRCGWTWRCCNSTRAARASARLIKGMEQNLLTAITSLRRIATNLRPRALDEGGLFFALQGLRDDFVERYGIACTLYADEAELRARRRRQHRDLPHRAGSADQHRAPRRAPAT